MKYSLCFLEHDSIIVVMSVCSRRKKSPFLTSERLNHDALSSFIVALSYLLNGSCVEPSGKHDVLLCLSFVSQLNAISKKWVLNWSSSFNLKSCMFIQPILFCFDFLVFSIIFCIFLYFFCILKKKVLYFAFISTLGHSQACIISFYQS